MSKQSEARLYTAIAQWLEQEDGENTDHEHHHSRLADQMTNAAVAVYDAGQESAREVSTQTP